VTADRDRVPIADLPRSTVAVWGRGRPFLDGPAFLLDVYGCAPRDLRRSPDGDRIVRECLRICNMTPANFDWVPTAVW
jgi:hypothetical protein